MSTRVLRQRHCYAPNRQARTAGCGGTVPIVKFPLLNLPPIAKSAYLGVNLEGPQFQHSRLYEQHSAAGQTYTLQRQGAVGLGLLDTIAVSLRVLVVVGVAVGRKRGGGGSAGQHFALRAACRRRDALLGLGHGDVERGLEGVGSLLAGLYGSPAARRLARVWWLRNCAVAASEVPGGVYA